MRLRDEVRLRIAEHARRAYPEECVGALLISEGEVVDTVPLENSALHRRRAFELSAREYVRAEVAAETRGLVVGGFYHSHPDAPAVPSARDREALAEGQCGLIISVTAKATQLGELFHA